MEKSAREMLDSPEFRDVVRRRWRVSLVLTAALFVLYYGYILLIAADKPLVSRRIGEVTTLGIPLGVAVHRAVVGADRGVRRLGQPRLRPRGRAACASACAAEADRRAHDDTRHADGVGDRVLPRHRRADARGHLLGGARGRARRRSSTRPAAASSAAPERPRPRRRLHERGVVPRHRRPGGAERLRRDDLRDRLARRLAGADVPHRRAAAEPRQVHVRRRRRVPAAAGAGAHRRGDRRDPHACSSTRSRRWSAPATWSS